MPHYALNEFRFLRVVEHLAHGAEKTRDREEGITTVLSSQAGNSLVYNLAFEQAVQHTDKNALRTHYKIMCTLLVTLPIKQYNGIMKSIDQRRTVNIARVDTKFEIREYVLSEKDEENARVFVHVDATFQLPEVLDLSEKLTAICKEANGE